MDTSNPYDLLGITPNATPDELKVAYHSKLKAFPAHTHPQEFKAIRAAYDKIRKGTTESASERFFTLKPLAAEIDLAALKPLQTRSIEQLKISLDELIQATF